MNTAEKIIQLYDHRPSDVSPQVENGYVQISNEIIDAIAGSKLFGAQVQCLFAIIRKTYGWNKKEDIISHSQFEKMTGLNNQSVRRALKELEGKKIIKITQKGSYKRTEKAKKHGGKKQKSTEAKSKKARSTTTCSCISYRFNKHYDQWLDKNSYKKNKQIRAKKHGTKDNTPVLDKYRESYTRACAGENFFCPKCGIIVPGGMDVCPTPNCKIVFSEIWDLDVEVLKWNS